MQSSLLDRSVFWYLSVDEVEDPHEMDMPERGLIRAVAMSAKDEIILGIESSGGKLIQRKLSDCSLKG